MAEDDNFDIDIYGDDANQDFSTITEVQDASAVTSTDNRIESDTRSTTLDNTYEEASGNQVPSHDDSNDQEPTSLDGAQSNQTTTQAISSTIGSDAVHSALPKQAPVQQGVKRKEGSLDEREIAPGATSALLVSELHWYQDEDDVRGWANQANVEDEIREITFNEHKVNGKSKGQVFVLLASQQAATALKYKLDSFSNPSGTGTPVASGRKVVPAFHPAHNPYKTLPKENPNRRDQNSDRGRGNYNSGGFRGNRGGSGGYNNRGGGMQNNNMGFNQNRNFSNPAMSQGGGFGGPGGGIGGGGFNAGGMGMGGFNNNFNRGGMMGGMNRGGGMMNRGGRGGMMGTMGMGGMGMGANMMGGGMMGGMGAMGMGGPMAGMGMGGRHSTFFGRDRFHRNRVDAYVSIPAGGFGGPQQPHFNPAFFNQGGQGNMGAGGDWGNHPNKRQRQE